MWCDTPRATGVTVVCSVSTAKRLGKKKPECLFQSLSLVLIPSVLKSFLFPFNFSLSPPFPLSSVSWEYQGPDSNSIRVLTLSLSLQWIVRIVKIDHGDGGRKAGPIWPHFEAIPRIDGTSRTGGLRTSKPIRRCSGDLQEDLHFPYWRYYYYLMIFYHCLLIYHHTY